MSGDRSYSGSLDLVSGGQCIGCPYKAPTRTAVGGISINFSSPTKATLIINGGIPIPIERLAFGINTASPYAMMGEWVFVEGTSSFPVYFGDRIKFYSTMSASGTLTATGNRSGSSSSIALSSLVSNDVWSLLIDSSSSYYKYYRYSFSGLNTIEGTSWTFLKSGSPSGSGLPFVAFRSQSASLVKNGIGPGVQARSSINNEQLMLEMEVQDELHYIKSTDGNEVIDPGIVEEASNAVKLLSEYVKFPH